MVFSPLTSGTVPHHWKYSSRYGARISRLIVHHWAGIAGGDARLIDPNAGASANYIIYSDGRLVGQVPEEFRAWTSGSPSADNPSITVEIQNAAGRVNGNDDDPASWRVTDAAYRTLVALAADLARRYQWGVITGATLIGHRQVASTACPGGYLWHRLPNVRYEANEILAGNGAGEGVTVIHYKKQDKNARGKGRMIPPGTGLFLHESIDDPGHASNVVGAPGYYSISPHIYIEGEPGDTVELLLRWQFSPGTGKVTNSDHYRQTLVIGEDGALKDNREFKGYVGSSTEPVAVYVRLEAAKGNKKPVKVTMLDCDSYLFKG